MGRQVRAEIKRLLIKKSVLTEIFWNNLKHIACAVLFQYNVPSVRLFMDWRRTVSIGRK